MPATALREVESDLGNLTLGELGQLAYSVREDKRELEKEIKALAQRFNEIKVVIYARMFEEGLDKTSVDGISMSRSDQEVPAVQDWDAVDHYIVENQMPSLLQRRISSALWNEMREAGIEVPGIDVVTKLDVNIRKS